MSVAIFGRRPFLPPVFKLGNSLSHKFWNASLDMCYFSFINTSFVVPGPLRNVANVLLPLSGVFTNYINAHSISKSSSWIPHVPVEPSTKSDFHVPRARIHCRKLWLFLYMPTDGFVHDSTHETPTPMDIKSSCVWFQQFQHWNHDRLRLHRFWACWPMAEIMH